MWDQRRVGAGGFLGFFGFVPFLVLFDSDEPGCFAFCEVFGRLGMYVLFVGTLSVGDTSAVQVEGVTEAEKLVHGSDLVVSKYRSA